MSFAEVRFPTDISYGSAGGPTFSTDVVTSVNGYEQRNINWDNARLNYNVAYGVKSETQLATLIAFFRARKGKAIGFRFKDWTDYKGVGEIIGTGDNAETDFQLIKTYTSGSDEEIRAISKPVAATVSIYFDAVEQTSGWTVDTTTGVITFDTAPANNIEITADFEFDVPVRFNTDQISTKLDTYGAGSAMQIPLIEVRI